MTVADEITRGPAAAPTPTRTTYVYGVHVVPAGAASPGRTECMVSDEGRADSFAAMRSGETMGQAFVTRYHVDAPDPAARSARTARKWFANGVERRT